MEIPFLGIEISATLILFLMVLAWLYHGYKQRERDLNEEDPRPKIKQRGRGMDFSASRDAAQLNARFQQAFIPMEPHEEDALRAFYLDELGLTEMRAPNYPKDVDGFWAVSGTRQIYFGTQPSFAFDVHALPSFPIANIKTVAQQLAASGHPVVWDNSTAYVQRLIVTDPAGTQIALIRG
ncbi:hypothetical protein BC777_1983 [Yoonia maricola]|uniref:VOC domain-containing protein n=1 Tax=Yoonia maricola TaxID=420999 RepID=A0A2M8WQC6_9RHOB|nr:hypothetical protein [Yoonia maricola]PJI93114.1 hypothetical protein BC777_1983 [Yoonia maricola]